LVLSRITTATRGKRKSWPISYKPRAIRHSPFRIPHLLELPSIPAS
jgi:hypothetical protein